MNGKRDVVFDVRSSLPSIAWLPTTPNTPTHPYWMTSASRTLPWPSDVVFNGTTISFTLGRAAYEPGTKTCTNVACHQAQGSIDYNPGGSGPVASPLIPLRWGGKMEYTTDGCNKCHPM